MPGDNSHANYPDVDDREELWRRIHKKLIVRDEKTGGVRPMSGAFKDTRGELSVDIASKTSPVKSVGDWAGLAGFACIIPKEYGHRVVADPLPANPAHALVLDRLGNPCIQKIQKHLRWIVEPQS